MKWQAILLVLCLSAILVSDKIHATVYINEVLINPPGSLDGSKEFIELAGTPGMLLDGYAIAFVNGAQRKIHPDSPFPPDCSDDPSLDVCIPEIDEFFSLDGLSLGPNGLLVIGKGASGEYSTVLTDTHFQRWNTLWNGLLDTTGKLQNDGSNTILLVRNRPGDTEAACPSGSCPDLRWGKDIGPDWEVIDGNELDPPQPGFIQYGNGNLDKGEDDGIGGSTLDLKGSATPGANSPEIDDDLEVVDEISYEHDQGWEYDLDDRSVDVGSTHGGLPPRNVHALDDPQSINPDVLTRVDYRTKGDGWAPVAGATGEMAGGNNWQDTATEQWVRGESAVGTGGVGDPPQLFYSNTANTNPDAIQPYDTNVPLWLDDALVPDYDFTTANTYQIMAGRVNPLAAAFIPGDSDRDGDSDADDIAKIAAVFGEDDWIFSNSYDAAPEGDEGDPATQTRPWDVDVTGNNGIEASDLQWTLNFQGDTTGRVVGVQYDSTTPTPAGSGVHLNPNAGVECTVTMSTNVPSGHALNALEGCDIVEIIVSAQVTAGANLTTEQENGIMQFIHDLALSTPDVMHVADVETLGTFAKTQETLENPQGNYGDQGINNINGFTTSFMQGLTTPADLYRVTLTAADVGSTNVTIAPAAMAKFQAGTPHGLKIGHTTDNGNPSASNYAAATVALTVISGLSADVNNDLSEDMGDLEDFVATLLGDPTYEDRSDFNCDGLVNGNDIGPFLNLFWGS